MHVQIEPGLFLVRYRADEELEPGRQAPLLAALQAAAAHQRTAVVFVVGPEVAHVDPAVPRFWLAATADPALRLAALGVVSESLGVRVAASGFGAANVVRGARFRVRSFAHEHEGVAWARDAMHGRLVTA